MYFFSCNDDTFPTFCLIAHFLRRMKLLPFELFSTLPMIPFPWERVDIQFPRIMDHLLVPWNQVEL